jgi:putative oxidoreductase
VNRLANFIVSGTAGRMLASGCLLIVVCSLVISSTHHIFQPYGFIRSMAGYGILPNSWLYPMAIGIPSTRLALAVMSAEKTFRRLALKCLCFLFGMYFLAQSSVLVRGIEADCGCFGFDSQRISIYSTIAPLILAVCSAIALSYSRIKE